MCCDGENNSLRFCRNGEHNSQVLVESLAKEIMNLDIPRVKYALFMDGRNIHKHTRTHLPFEANKNPSLILLHKYKHILKTSLENFKPPPPPPLPPPTRIQEPEKRRGRTTASDLLKIHTDERHFSLFVLCGV